MKLIYFNSHSIKRSASHIDGKIVDKMRGLERQIAAVLVAIKRDRSSLLNVQGLAEPITFCLRSALMKTV